MQIFIHEYILQVACATRTAARRSLEWKNVFLMMGTKNNDEIAIIIGSGDKVLGISDLKK